MRLGGPVFVEGCDPQAYAEAHVAKGLRAAYWPDWADAHTEATACRELAVALEKRGVIPAEVGIWRNVLSPDPVKARSAVEYAVRRLATAEEVGARCAVNIVGSWNETYWDGPHSAHYSRDFFDAAVQAARKIIDEVKPRRTKLAFEMMPCQFLDSADEYMRLLAAVDRKAAGVHLDPANMISSPRLLYSNAAFFRDAFAAFGGAVLTVHLKDVRLAPSKFTVSMEEVPIGRGELDYENLLRLLNGLDRDTPCMLEHLDSEREYDEAAGNVRAIAERAGVTLA